MCLPRHTEIPPVPLGHRSSLLKVLAAGHRRPQPTLRQGSGPQDVPTRFPCDRRRRGVPRPVVGPRKGKGSKCLWGTPSASTSLLGLSSVLFPSVYRPRPRPVLESPFSPWWHPSRPASPLPDPPTPTSHSGGAGDGRVRAGGRGSGRRTCTVRIEKGGAGRVVGVRRRVFNSPVFAVHRGSGRGLPSRPLNPDLLGEVTLVGVFRVEVAFLSRCKHQDQNSKK